MPNTASNCNKPTHDAAQQRRAAARQLTVMGQRFGKAHTDPGPSTGRAPDPERVMAVLRRTCAAEHRRQHTHRAVYEAHQAGLHDLHDVLLACILVFG